MHVRLCFDALKCIVQLKQLFSFKWNTTIDDWGHLPGVLAHCYSVSDYKEIIENILKLRYDKVTFLSEFYKWITDMKGHGECRFRKCIHCFVGIFYNDVFAIIIFIILIHLFHNSFKYFYFMCQTLRPTGTHLEVLQRLFTAHVNDYWHVCTHVQYLNQSCNYCLTLLVTIHFLFFHG